MITAKLHLFSTLCMTGVIWIIQLVHYPLFDQVGEQQFREYSRQHSRRITWVVAPLMGCELACSYLLWKNSPGFAATAGLAMVALLWLSTAFYFGPIHGKLSRGFDPKLHQYLVKGNWLRTILWSARAVLVVFFL